MYNTKLCISKEHMHYILTKSDNCTAVKKHERDKQLCGPVYYVPMLKMRGREGDCFRPKCTIDNHENHTENVIKVR